MANYNISIEINVDDEEITVFDIDNGLNEYHYALSSEEGIDILSKIFGSGVDTTVYSQGRTFNSIEEYDDYVGRQ